MDAGLVIAIAMAVAFAVTNGLHDASNAVATLVASSSSLTTEAASTTRVSSCSWVHARGS